ncbi:MAG TPA: selenide, water dikinase SelD [Gemmatimonadales bacterium]|nr:selenide, water dikinase SelD [Gemmatimonadales bacterium]
MTDAPTAPIRLTAFSHGAGCACKLGSTELTEVLRHLPPISDPRILVDAATRDDAAVYRLDADRALIATTDFFTPIVDDAFDWGRIAAANALSDVYAMGGRPLFALNLVGWPRTSLPFALLGEVLRGAGQVAAEAGCLLVGGHSVDDPEPKFGLAVVGEVHPDRVLTNAAGQAGDLLVLTKPLGTGILTTALKRDRIGAEALAPAVESMATLNNGAMRAALAHGVRCATDITGFGLLGHLGNVLAGSGLGAEVWVDALPLLPGARELAEAGVVPGGTERNYKAADGTRWAPGLSRAEQVLCCDAQTSGGLLLAVRPERAEALVAALRAERTPAAAVIGQLVAGPAGSVSVERHR